MRNVFINKDDSERFSRMGFLRKKMLDSLLVSQLIGLYQDKFPEGSQNFYSSTFLKDVEQKKKLNNALVGLLDPIIQEYFENYKILGAQFLVKNPGEGGYMPFHQDWTIVDEEKDRSVTVWMSLTGADESSGAIKVIPYSHEFSREKRGPGNFDQLSEIQQLLERYAHQLIMEAGEAFIFDQSIIHGSGKNNTEHPRIAVAFGLVHKDAELVFYHMDSPSTLQKYKVPDDFFITFSNDGNAPEEGILEGAIQQNYQKVGAEDLKNKMSKLYDDTSVSFVPKPLFVDAEIQKKFDRDGYVKLPMLNATEVVELRDYYLSLHHDHIKDYGFHISLENESDDYRTGVFKKLFGTIMPNLDPLLRDYQAFTASYVIKEAGLQNIVPPHQDWNFVDETEFCSATVWIPLMDVNKNNGALGVIKGSHKLFNLPRASPSPQAKSILSDHVFNLFPFVEVIEMKAGEALVFNNKTIHASPPNISGITRIAAGIGITQKDAQLLHYYQTPGEKEVVEVYEVDPQFFPLYNNSKMSAYYNKGEKPTALKVKESFYKSAPNYTKEEITQLVCKTQGVAFNEELMKELAAMYNYNMDGTKKVIQQEEKIEEPVLTVSPEPKRNFFQTYSPSNILAEIKYRLSKK
jgi:ectoine hydroxylase-related dioxygenase (phytanoyl-CoA dioxygenase family)